MSKKYNKVTYNGNTLIDLTSDTVTADALLSGETAHDASGEIITGTYVSPTVFTGATSTTAGTSGLVPAPAAGDQGKVLLGNATWADYGFTTEAKQALITCLGKMAFINGNGETYVDALATALGIPTDPVFKYVQDGLVCQYDGIWNTRSGHVDTMSTWEDLSSNHYDLLCYTNPAATETSTLSGTNVGSNYVHLGTTSENFRVFATESTDILPCFTALSDGTLEVVIKEYANAIRTVFMTAGTQTAGVHAKCFWRRPNSSGIVVTCNYNTGGRAIPDTVETTSPHQFSIVYDGTSEDEIEGYKDGGDDTGVSSWTCSMPTTRTISVGNRTYAGATTTSYQFVGEIYAIRYYNRKLTAEERAKNLALDKERFGF